MTAKLIVTALYTAFMTSCIWAFCVFPVKTDGEGTIIGNYGTVAVAILFGVVCVFTAIFSISWLVENWND